MPGSDLSRSIIVWGLATYVLFRLAQYVLLARVYLTCAARVLRFEIAGADDLSAEDRQIIESADRQLERAGFQPLFIAQVVSLLTYYERPEFIRIFTSGRDPVRAFVSRRLMPETGAVTVIELETPLVNGRTLVTRNSLPAELLSFAGRDEEVVVGSDTAGLVRRHLERLDSSAVAADGRAADVTGILNELNERGIEARQDLLRKAFITSSADASLDRFTLKGALALAHRSIRSARRQGVVRTVPASEVQVLGEDDLQLRILADMNALSRIAGHPARAPGSDYPLWVMMGGTAVVSFVGMSLLWSPAVAVTILAVVAFHEAGHALAMRMAGYRDVNIFFVPFLGALTVGRDTGSSVRQRLIVMLAGPVPGLWLAVLALVLHQQLGGPFFLRPLAFALLFINALNLLPLTPLDGGRAVELLTSPASAVRLGLQALSGLGLLGLGVYLRSGFLIFLGAWWLFLLRRQVSLWRLRRQVDAILAGRSNTADIVRAVCTAFASPAYSAWGAATRISTARLLVQQFSQVAPTPGDQLLAVALYVFAWVPAVVALLIWRGLVLT
jgi:Zn-dependent protease